MVYDTLCFVDCTLFDSLALCVCLNVLFERGSTETILRRLLTVRLEVKTYFSFENWFWLFDCFIVCFDCFWPLFEYRTQRSGKMASASAGRWLVGPATCIFFLLLLYDIKGFYPTVPVRELSASAVLFESVCSFAISYPFTRLAHMWEPPYYYYECFFCGLRGGGGVGTGEVEGFLLFLSWTLLVRR